MTKEEVIQRDKIQKIFIHSLKKEKNIVLESSEKEKEGVYLQKLEQLLV